MSPRAILVVGLVGFLLYANPGYLSYDSIQQLLEARSGQRTDLYSPVMTWLWTAADWAIPGPFAMLLIQAACLLLGAYLLLARFMSERAAAICASVVLWFPAASSVMAVIWEDSQMSGYLLLGTALILSERRGVKAFGIGLLVLAAAMRESAFATTLPIIVLLLSWSATHRWWQRYALAVATWLVVVGLAFAANRVVTHTPKPAVTVVDADFAARLDRFAKLLRLDDAGGSPVYIWFTDVQDLLGSAKRIGHAAAPSAVQAKLQSAMVWLGTTWLFKPYVYLVLACLLLPLCLRDRRVATVCLSGIASEVVQLFLVVSPDYRHSLWLVIATVATAIILIATRARRPT